MDAKWLVSQFLFRFVTILPWLVSGGVVFAIVSWSPLGNALLRHLRERRRDAEVSEELLAELAAMRQMIGEVTERLDATEQHLARQLGAPPRPAGRPERSVELSDPDRRPTPV